MTDQLTPDRARRLWLKAALAGSGSCCLCSAAQGALLEYPLAATEIATGTWAVYGQSEYFNTDNGGNIVNVAFIEVPDGVVVIDTGPSRRYGQALQALIEKTVPGKVILRVYNTHHHPDHCFGNQLFDPALIAAPQGVIDNLRAEGEGFADNLYRLLGDWMRGTAPVLPGLVQEEGVQDIGGRRFTHTLLAGHTSSDLVIRDESTGVLFTGDLAFLYRAPTTPHADLPVWQASIKALQGMDRELILPGHGPDDDRGESLLQTSDYLSWLDGNLREAVLAGLTMNEAMQKPIPPRLQALNVVRAEFGRSVVHLYPRYEDALYQRVEVER